mgnify:CR=1 FL=1
MTPGLTVIPISTYDEHARHVARHLREHDRAEVTATGGGTPENAVELSVLVSPGESYAVVNNAGEPLSLLGCSNMVLGTEGSPWMLATDGAERHRRAMIQIGLAYTRYLRDRYTRLWNVVHVDNHPSIRYLLTIGFEVHEQVIVLPNGGRVRLFDMMGK